MTFNDFLALLAQGLLVIAIPVVIGFLFQWLRQKGAELRAHLTTQQEQFIDTAVSTAVRAAEQAGLSNQLAGGGQAKKAYAVKAVQDYLDRLGIKLDVNQLVILIEAEVNKQFSNAAPVVDDAATRSALLDKAVQRAVLAAEQSGLTGLPCLSIDLRGMRMLDVGLIPIVTMMSWPVEMPPRMPPALFERNPCGVSSSPCSEPR